MKSTELMTMDENTMVARVGMAKFPKDLTPSEQRLLAKAAITYGFDPIMKEISIFQGSVYISIDGRYRAAQETGDLDGVSTRPATKQEREDWQIPEDDFFFRAEVFVKSMSRPMVGWGRVRRAEMKGPDYLPVVNNPQRMAEKRAEAQALRKAFHIPLPSIEDIGNPDADDIDVKVTVVPPKQIAEAAKTSQQLPDAPPIPAHPDVPRDTQKPPAEQTGTQGQPTGEMLPNGLNLTETKQQLTDANWSPAEVSKYLTAHFKVTGKKVSDMLGQLTADQAKEFTKDISDRLSMK